MHQVVHQLEQFDPSNVESLDIDAQSQELFSSTNQRYDDEGAEVVEGSFD